ncbi:hypothetical protein CROQUDRAFT_669551 [Cronartium quercuum f. sp. fusiforme G11]|uniref:DUF7729 domain-containing protein n=1 Tax=Cronartium quercuum f. sp. fusiforme G11 TaxID=708437 RepID=A0A9P6NT69_9BASI|nr:hypothetical protein CROQUDRAFT_669551 [Cronartium quercuum f. sp. fusiforme G11]
MLFLLSAFISFTQLASATDSSPWPTNLNLSNTNATTTINNFNPTSVTSANASSITANWNPSAVNNPGTNARIPSSVSSACQAFLARLNSNSQVKSCTAPLMNATASFSAGPQAVTPAQVKAAFDGLCGPNSGAGCETILMHEILGHFAGNCSSELSAGVPAIQAAYDVLYIMTPFKGALCAQDPKTGDYCPTFIATSVINATADSKDPAMSASDFKTMITNLLPTGKLVTQLGSSLTKRAIAVVNSASAYTGRHDLHRRDHSTRAKSSHLHYRDVSTNWTTTNATFNTNATNTTTTTTINGTFSSSNSTYHPDPKTFTTTNLAFLFLSPTLPTSALCTPCTVSVLASYIAFEQSTPHFGGLASSGYLSGQVKLWKGISGKCGIQFANSISTRAGIVSMMGSANAGTGLQIPSFSTSFLSILLGSLLVLL